MVLHLCKIFLKSMQKLLILVLKKSGIFFVSRGSPRMIKLNKLYIRKKFPTLLFKPNPEPNETIEVLREIQCFFFGKTTENPRFLQTDCQAYIFLVLVKS